MALSDVGPARLLSRPCRVIFAGWESTTSRLQQAGWQLSSEQDFNVNTVRLALRFEPARLFMIAEAQPWEFFKERSEAPTFHIRHAATDMHIVLTESSFDFRPFDAAPQLTTAVRRSIEDYGIFAPCLARTEEIIVEPATVAGLLEQIKSLQAPELAAIRERNRQAERRDQAPMQQQRFHAQIVSLAA